MRMLITGGGRGIGRAIAEKALTQGHTVHVTVRKPGAAPAGTIEHVVDVRDLPAMRKLAQDHAGEVDCLIVNAGVGHFLNPKNADAAEKAVEMLEVNVTAAISTCYLWAYEWIRLNHREQSIAILSSLAAGRGLPKASAYGASKMAELTFAQGFARDVEKHGIKVTTVQPGFVDTDMSRTNPNRPFLVSADRAARHILEGIEKGREFVVFPRALAWTTWVLNSVLPYWVFRAFSRLMVNKVGATK